MPSYHPLGASYSRTRLLEPYPAGRPRRLSKALMGGGMPAPAGYVWPLRRRKRKAPDVPRRRPPHNAATTQSVPIPPTAFLAPVKRCKIRRPARVDRAIRRLPATLIGRPAAGEVFPRRQLRRRDDRKSCPRRRRIRLAGLFAIPKTHAALIPRGRPRRTLRRRRTFRSIIQRMNWVEIKQCLDPMFARGIFVREGPTRARVSHNTSPGGTVVTGLGTFVRSGPTRSTFFRDRC
jgi:hypothetical protein